jgi:hypothetical protein
MKSVSCEYKQIRKNGSTISTHLECRLAVEKHDQEHYELMF